MTLDQISAIGKELAEYVDRFSDCFSRSEGRGLLAVYVKGQLSDLQRKTAEAIGLCFGTPPRTLQRFLESIKWDEDKLRDRCQRIVVEEHSHPEAVGIVDESAVAKSGSHTVGIQRQWCGSEGKVENCVVGVHAAYSAPGFQCVIDSELYLPEEWADDLERRRKNYVPEEVKFRTKPQIALGIIDRAGANGIQVAAWTFDEFYGRSHEFLDGLEKRGQAFVGEVPVNFHGWVRKPRIVHFQPKEGRKPKRSRVARRHPSCEVGNLLKFSPVFRDQTWQRYRIKDTMKGPEIWKVKWVRFWRKEKNGLPGRQHCLLVAHNVLTREEKFFVANRVPGRDGVTLRWLLHVAFSRWSVESCFREAKEELGMDHYEVRGWRCVHRHFFVTHVSHLFCARLRQEYDESDTTPTARLTIEQVRSAVNTWLSAVDLKPKARIARYKHELKNQAYYQRRNAQSRKSHTTTRLKRLRVYGIDPDRVKSCLKAKSPPIKMAC